jgi:hypothetical protein
MFLLGTLVRVESHGDEVAPACSLEHPVGAQQYRCRHLNPECLGGNYILDNGSNMMDTSQAQSGASDSYRGVKLPRGMTPACLDEVARLINLHQLDSCEDSDDEGAIKVFEAVRRHLR